MNAKESRRLDNKIRNFLKWHRRPEHFDVDGQIEEGLSNEYDSKKSNRVSAQKGSELERGISKDENQQGRIEIASVV